MTGPELSLEELEELEEKVVDQAFHHAVATMRRRRHLRALEELEKKPLEARTVAHQQQVAHHRREARAQEHVMRDTIREAQRLELLAGHPASGGTP